MQQRILLLVAGLFATLTAGCGPLAGADVAEARVIGLPIERAKPAPAGAEAADTTATVDENGIDACPVTLPAAKPFSPPPPYRSTYPYEGRSWYGTASLWTALPDDGRWAQLAHGDKVFWWRVGYSGSSESQPLLWMTATRLDGEGSVEQEPPATNAYHRDFHWAMLTGFKVPSSGCWEITGHYLLEGNEFTLRFVVWVGD